LEIIRLIIFTGLVLNGKDFTLLYITWVEKRHLKKKKKREFFLKYIFLFNIDAIMSNSSIIYHTKISYYGVQKISAKTPGTKIVG